jgi:hypothetical protein
MNDDKKYKIPEGSFKSTADEAKLKDAALHGIITLGNELNLTNERLSGLREGIQKAAELLKNSSENIAKANEKYSHALAWFTGALVFVGLLQILAIITR